MEQSSPPTWSNHHGNQTCTPDRVVSPRSVDELRELVREAERREITIRAVGSHHSWSDVALTEGILVEPKHLGGAIADAGDGLVRVPAGTTIHDLNEQLDERGLALRNMGGYDGQTLAGVVSTSTHGSGFAYGAFCDIVRSLDIVVAGGDLLRVEPKTGALTDPGSYDEGRLVQDDDVFRAAACGIGCLGIVTSLVIEVGEKFDLCETRTKTTWEKLRDTVSEDSIAGYDHWELFLSPYGRGPVLVTERRPAREGEARSDDDKRRPPRIEAGARSKALTRLVGWLARTHPRVLHHWFPVLLWQMKDTAYVGPSYKVFHIGQANHVAAWSSELAVPANDRSFVAVVDRILEIAAEQGKQGRWHTSPIALRFVKASPSYASMMYDRPTMMIELILSKGTKHGFELLAAYERELSKDFKVRPHWGQYNVLDEATDLAALYPEWEKWLEVYRRFNATGVFASPFTQRIGLT